MLKKIVIQRLENLIRKNFIFFLSYYTYFKKTYKKNKKQQISVINTFDSGGGAANIARELSREVQKFFTLKMFVKNKLSKEIWISEIEKRKYSFLEEVLRREALEKGWIEFSGFHALSLINSEFFNDSSIVHIHNLHGDFFSPALFSNLLQGKKVFWTLHDESLLTGHCSCTLGCTRWTNGCGNCPDLSIYPAVKFDNTSSVSKYKRKWLLKLNPTIICPSEWLAKRFKIVYPTLKNIKVIPNGVDTSLYYPHDKKSAREKFNLPIEKQLVLFVAEFATANPFKGGEIVRKLISDQSLHNLVFITIGGGQEENLNNHISFPYINCEKELSQLYAACDVLLYPTQADNFPLVILESMACGTPVIASEIGGIPEIIINEGLGFLIQNHQESNAFKSALIDFFKLPEVKRSELTKNVRKEVEKKYNFNLMVQKYLQLYSDN